VGFGECNIAPGERLFPFIIFVSHHAGIPALFNQISVELSTASEKCSFQVAVVRGAIKVQVVLEAE
jgi:hypothetical protein